MKITKNNVATIVLVIVLGIGTFGYAKGFKPTQKVKYIDTQYAADFSNDKILVGAAHNIFVGKVIKQSGVSKSSTGVETQFEVEVINNIKGDLKDTVIVNQVGGNDNGTLYVVGDKDDKQNPQSYMLQPGSTYLLTTRYSSKYNWYTINSYPTANKLLTSADISTDQVTSLALKDQRVQQLEDAYKNEIPLEVDVKNNNALNSYQSLNKMQ